jgi:hypothetical protein
VAFAQDQYWDGQRFTRLEPGMTVSVRSTEGIDATQTDYRVFRGVVAEDVRGTNNRMAILRGSPVELIARRTRDGQIVLDLESVVVNGKRYAVKAEPNRVATDDAYPLIGSIVGAISGGRVRGPDVHIPRDTVMNFRLERPLEINVPDRGVDRNGYHYHDYYRDYYERR